LRELRVEDRRAITRKGVITGASILILCGIATFAVAHNSAHDIDSFIRRQVIEYLQQRFDGEVEIASLKIHLPPQSKWRRLLSRGKGSLIGVDAAGVAIRNKGRRDVPPLVEIENVAFNVDLSTLFAATRTVSLIELGGLSITIPSDERPAARASNTALLEGTSIQEVRIRRATLTILPRQKDRVPLRFDIQELHLSSQGRNAPMSYEAILTNSRPSGLIRAKGALGPWNSDNPAETPLNGEYTFENADLSVFPAIAGILHSRGHFDGTLHAITANGEASVPDFRLKMAGNPISLLTHFEVQVDGRNGNTILKPVFARLGSTDFTTSGVVIKHDGDPRRTISLNIAMPDGNVKDLLRVSMKGPGLMDGRISLRSRIVIPPLSGKIRQRLQLAGEFAIREGQFLNASLREQIDKFSRKGQGQPTNANIDDVLFRMQGDFALRDQNLTLTALRFDVPGADVAMDGSYDLAANQLDFHGTLKLKARVSQTMTGWKRWALKPVDPFFAKEGAGTFLHVAMGGTTASPKFGLDHGNKGTEIANR
jgi:hypothetical protein